MQRALIYQQDLLQKMEYAEVAYWQDFYDHAPPVIQSELGICYKKFRSGAVGFAMQKFDILAFNRVLLSGFEEPLNVESIKEIKEFYIALNIPRYFITFCQYSRSRKNTHILLEQGLIKYNHWAKLAKPLYQNKLSAARGIKIVEADVDDSILVGSILCSAFDFPEAMCAFMSGTIGKANWQYFIAYVDDAPAGVGALHIFEDVASLSIAGTIPLYRGRGVQKALIDHRIQAAYEAGCSFIKSETAEPGKDKPAISYNNMIACGLEPIYLRPNYIFYN